MTDPVVRTNEVSSVNETETATVTVGVIGSKTFQDLPVQAGETAENLFSRADISTQGRDLYVNQEQQDWDYVYQPGDFLAVMQHISAGR